GFDVSLLAPRVGPERILDFMLRTGPYELTLDELMTHENGLDLGALEPRLPDALRTPSGNVELAPQPMVDDVPRLRAALDRRSNGGFVLIGRRHLRSNNSWMHNVNVLVKGKPQCTLQVNPSDAERVGITDGGSAKVSSRVGAVVADVEVTDAVMRGVVSLPHGWGHDAPGVRMSIASNHAGVNSNLLADEELFDVISGNAVLNGIPVEVEPAPSLRIVDGIGAEDPQRTMTV
ncbi:MAG TPA: molybdopterin dinucleotide binding domain-containing protein, partial [Mycobacteriales bacterium]|nr:molybdopterin dinucleotide binding domain-containing protein [Mycobacteriales bacterium]